MPEYLGTQDAAAVLGLSVVRTKQLAAEGRIGRMVAGRYLFTPKELEAFKAVARPTGKRIPKPRKAKKKSRK